MSSTVTNISQTINVGFPESGKDNPSQGFRDNFSAINQAFGVAASELTYLQQNAVQVTLPNDFQFTGSINRVKLKNSGFYASPVGLGVTNTVSLDYQQANYYKTADPITSLDTTYFRVDNWPGTFETVGISATMRLEVTINASTTVSFSPSLGAGAKIYADESMPKAVTAGTYIWDLWTVDGGKNVYVKLVGESWTEIV